MEKKAALPTGPWAHGPLPMALHTGTHSPHGAMGTKGPFDPELYFGKMEKFWR